jgi:hypothetical protein
MCEAIRHFDQEEYARVLDSHRARACGLSQGACEAILAEHGADDQQARNGAYNYLHLGPHHNSTRRGSQSEYDRLLHAFGARHKSPRECVEYLESLGFGYGQSKTAVYNFREELGIGGR